MHSETVDRTGFETAQQPKAVSRSSRPSPPRSTDQATQIGKKFGLPLVVLAIILALWYWTTAAKKVSPLLVPPPDQVWSALVSGVFEGLWWSHIGTTLYEMVAGFGIGVVAGLVIGALFAFMATLYQAFYPFVIALQSFPKVAIAPLLVVALGYGPEPKIIVAALLAYFPVMSAAIAGFTNVNPEEHKLMRANQANKWQELRYLRLPNAMSYVFPSFDVAVVMALLGAVAAELVGAQAGLGYLLMERQAFGDSASMYAALILLAIMGITLRSAAQGLRSILPRSIVPR
ncbi:ABC transporter permease [Paeniglutamicibacter sp. MACA_103]|uniref:ABC transporter permease n=1 Tax=Paeniglutamicibacter sp. MACA_103 TaxID=3377337 RepID=UPI003893B5C6